MPAIFRRVAALAAPLALTACLTATPPTDPRIADAARALRDEAAQLHSVLAIESAPQCAYEQNKNSYGALAASAARLEARIAARGGSPALAQAGKALARLVEDARASHIAASSRTDDAYGLCMAPGAIALNAQAFDRATSAIAESQTSSGDAP